MSSKNPTCFYVKGHTRTIFLTICKIDFAISNHLEQETNNHCDYLPYFWLYIFANTYTFCNFARR